MDIFEGLFGSVEKGKVAYNEHTTVGSDRGDAGHSSVSINRE